MSDGAHAAAQVAAERGLYTKEITDQLQKRLDDRPSEVERMRRDMAGAMMLDTWSQTPPNASMCAESMAAAAWQGADAFVAAMTPGVEEVGGE